MSLHAVGEVPDADTRSDPAALVQVGLFRAGPARAFGLGLLLVALAVVALASIRYGSRPLSLEAVFDAFTSFDRDLTDHLVVRDQRVPRTLVGLLVGVALGLSGAVMQGVARNPLADPGILGVSAGSALFVVVAIYVFGVTGLLGYVWWAFAGAAVASVAVYALGALGREGATPIKLALAGTAVTALCQSVTSAVLVVDVNTLNQFRFWEAGSLAGRTSEIAGQMAPFIILGSGMALAAGPSLNALALGDDVARSLGQRVHLARGFAAVSVVLLVGAATAAAGPIVFVGLVVPHVARAITGPDYRWVLPYSGVLAAILLLAADVVGRVVDRPGEVQVGLITALVGAPFFIALVRRRKLAEL
ncbi:iron complex transport system permease protein [Marmoricola sp. OAE513]|uniref:FecCD family ABC transporter permease n=1 Tax=Marmoricola sp. OAE513 TaxID=2817894 RepID=UPI001DF8FC07